MVTVTPYNANLFTPLDDRPVLGQSLGNVTLLRLDRLNSRAPGNKLFKLRPHLRRAREQGLERVVSFGGAWSNHLHALAAVGAEEGLQTVAVVRGDDPGEDTPTLRDVQALGMQLLRVSRAEYRRRNDNDYLAALQARFSPCLVIPEGGAGVEAVTGCMEIAELVLRCKPAPARVLVAVGTGTTLAGLVAGLPADCQVVGVSALKGAHDLETRVEGALASLGSPSAAPWQILHGDHCGGFARVNAELKAFMQDFEKVHAIPLEPVYTGKLMLALHRRLANGEWDNQEPILVVHSGGLQGRRGYPWLSTPGH